MTSTEVSTTDQIRKQVLDLSLLGLRQVDIALELGVSQPRVSQLLAEARREFRSEAEKSYEEHVGEALARCELLLRSLHRGIESGDPRSVDSATRLVDRISKLLGLDHRDRMSERTVRVQETQVRLLGEGVSVMLDHLGVTGDRRVEAIEVLQRALADAEAAE